MDLISTTKYFNNHRREHKKEHSLEVIFYITIASVLAGAESWYDVEDFGIAKKEFLSRKIPINIQLSVYYPLAELKDYIVDD